MTATLDEATPETTPDATGYPRVVEGRYGDKYLQRAPAVDGEADLYIGRSGGPSRVRESSFTPVVTMVDGVEVPNMVSARVGDRVVYVGNRGEVIEVTENSTWQICRVRFDTGRERSIYVCDLAPETVIDVTRLAELLGRSEQDVMDLRHEWASEHERLVGIAAECAAEFDWCSVFEQGCDELGIESPRRREVPIEWTATITATLDEDDVLYYCQRLSEYPDSVESANVRATFEINSSTEGLDGECQCGRLEEEIDFDEYLPGRWTFDEVVSMRCDHC